jgi:hypothetical protein
MFFYNWLKKVFYAILLFVITACGSGLATTPYTEDKMDTLTASSGSIKVLRVANPDHVAAMDSVVYKIEGRETQVLFKSTNGGELFEQLQILPEDLKETKLQSLFIYSRRK